MGVVSMSVVGSGVALTFVALFAAQPEGHAEAAPSTPVAAGLPIHFSIVAEGVAREAARVEAEQSRHGDGTLSMWLPVSVPYRGSFLKYGARLRVEPALLAGIALQESSFDPWAGCDRAGAGKGIMQIEDQPQFCGPGGVDASIERAAKMLAQLPQRPAARGRRRCSPSTTAPA